MPEPQKMKNNGLGLYLNVLSHYFPYFWGSGRAHTSTVRVFIVLLSGIFCCLGFSGVIFFAVWAGAQAPPNQQKKKNARTQTAKT